MTTAPAATPPAPPAVAPPATPPAPAPAAPSPAPAPAPSSEAARIAALEGQLRAVSDALVSEVPEKFRALIPAGLPVADQVKWLQQAKAAGLFGGAPTAPVPTTDTGKPTTTPKTADLSTLPPVARMAAAYGKTK